MDRRTVNRIQGFSMVEATKQAVQAADWLTKADRGAIRSILRLAEVLDDPDFPVIDGRYDNVSQSLYLKYCDALGLTPVSRRVKQEKPSEKKPESKLEQLQKGAKGLRVVS